MVFSHLGTEGEDRGRSSTRRPTCFGLCGNARGTSPMGKNIRIWPICCFSSKAVPDVGGSDPSPDALGTVLGLECGTAAPKVDQ